MARSLKYDPCGPPNGIFRYILHQLQFQNNQEQPYRNVVIGVRMSCLGLCPGSLILYFMVHIWLQQHPTSFLLSTITSTSVKVWHHFIVCFPTPIQLLLFTCRGREMWNIMMSCHRDMGRVLFFEALTLGILFIPKCLFLLTMMPVQDHGVWEWYRRITACRQAKWYKHLRKWY